MKTKNTPLFIFLFFYLINGISQNMQEGFTYLETGKYQEAKTYFNTVLKTYPTNKTARLCYGRAVGLNGNSKEAVTIFTNLLHDFPADFEIKLNYAESLLWNKEYTSAKKYYTKLLQEDNTSFPVLLGYANTLSNLKLFDEALLYVNKAMLVSPGNKNALISKKYICLGLANAKLNAQNYDSAEKILHQNLAIFPKDKETLLNLANLYLISNQIDKAKKTYEIIGETQEDILISLNGLALASHLKGKNKEALGIAKKANAKINNTKDTTLKNQTKERYVQALIWNKKYPLATNEIEKLVQEKGPKNWILSLRATLNIYKSNFKKSILDYNTILKKDSLSFDGNLGKANALKASALYNKAYKSAEKTLLIYKNQKDALNFIKNLDRKFTPFVENKISYSYDNGDNKAYSSTINLEFPLSTRFKLLGNYNYRNTKNAITKTKAVSNNFQAGLVYQIQPNLTMKGKLGITSVNGENDYTQLLTDVFFNLKPFKLQNLEVGYKRDLQNFNATLLDREIVQNNFIANYSINTNFNFGSYIQYYYTTQSDDNARNLLFASLYYKILETPSLKAGINYQNISFKNQVPTIYFSPEKFKAVEVFFNIIKDEVISKKKEWFYELTAASGFQFIEDNKKQSTYRIQGKLGYKFSERSLLSFYGTQSNIASTTASGFKFTELGLHFKWFLKKKLFKKEAK